jgi:hypothetical protein
VDTAEILKACYPVGAVYISTVSTNPSNIFGFGTWERIEDRFLLAAGSTYAAGSTGGEATHTLTVDEMPRHKHYGIFVDGNASFEIGFNSGSNITTSAGRMNTTSGSAQFRIETANSGNSQPHNNMPPYLTVYMWKRVG